jgi:hypothetical protein
VPQAICVLVATSTLLMLGPAAECWSTHVEIVAFAALILLILRGYVLIDRMWSDQSTAKLSLVLRICRWFDWTFSIERKPENQPHRDEDEQKSAESASHTPAGELGEKPENDRLAVDPPLRLGEGKAKRASPKKR